MRRLVSVTAAGLLLAAAIQPVGATARAFPEFVSFSRGLGEFPEGVAVDKVGNVYVSFDAPRGEIRRYSQTGEESLLIDFGSPGVLGLAVDPLGNVYAARTGPGRGVYRIIADGMAELVPGTDAIVFPNALAFDKSGTLYISESFSFDEPLIEYVGCDIGSGSFFGPGGIWRVAPGGAAELWLRHELLTGVCAPNPIPFPVGANGIAYRNGNVYVNNTERGLVILVPVDMAGEPGAPKILAAIRDTVPPSPFGPPNPDGLALDVRGNLYVPIINQSRLVRVSLDGALVQTLATADDGIDFPASVAFGSGRGERQAVFVTNFAIGPPGGAGPGLVKLNVGTPGMPLP